jgi:hypothetical protein
VISDIQSKLDSFVEQLQSARDTGMIWIFFSHKSIFLKCYL